MNFMDQKIDYLFVESQDIDADDAKNIHIFEGQYNQISKRFTPFENKSCCGKCSFKPRPESIQIVARRNNEETRKAARTIAKDYEDCGITVCGNCVARLYSDEI